MRPIILALPKGRILDEAAAVFARAGHDLAPVFADSRRLMSTGRLPCQRRADDGHPNKLIGRPAVHSRSLDARGGGHWPLRPADRQLRAIGKHHHAAVFAIRLNPRNRFQAH